MTLHQQYLTLVYQRVWLVNEFRKLQRRKGAAGRKLAQTKELCGRIRQLDRDVVKFTAMVHRLAPGSSLRKEREERKGE